MPYALCSLPNATMPYALCSLPNATMLYALCKAQTPNPKTQTLNHCSEVDSSSPSGEEVGRRGEYDPER
ncbi:MAG: hypothetical protein ACM3MI_07270 [Clostridiales bacterium]